MSSTRAAESSTVVLGVVESGYDGVSIVDFVLILHGKLRWYCVI